MGMTHEFALFSMETSISFDNINRENCYIIHDYLICYIYDSFNWINTLSLYNKEQQGLCYTGITIFQGDSLSHLLNILKAWYNLFILGQETLILRGEFSITTGFYEKITVQKEDVLSQILGVITLTEKAINTNQKIIHFGL